MLFHTAQSGLHFLSDNLFHSNIQSIHIAENPLFGYLQYFPVAGHRYLSFLPGAILVISKLFNFIIICSTCLQAASLTLACQAAQSCGHEVRIRPFVHRYTSAEELNSILLYASSLRMTAKLYGMPIHGSYVFFVILCIIIIILTLGMCINISLGII